ncbi:MAG: serine protease [Firmicutes bacterium]|nr:serine protease [Bacillota bacterium]
MKKMIFTVIVFLFILTGCVSILNEEDTDEYRALSSQYEEFVIHDIGQIDQFQAFVNKATFESILSNVMIKVQLFNDLNNLVETRTGSGVIFIDSGSFHYVLTSFNLTYPADYSATYQIFDYQGRTSTGYIDVVSEEHNLSVIRYLKARWDMLPTIEIAEDLSLPGEPMLLFGYKGQMMNAMIMGLMIENTDINDDTQRFFHTSIPSDLYANGGAIINVNNELVGIQIDVLDGNCYAVSIIEIKALVDLFNERHAIN